MEQKIIEILKEHIEGLENAEVCEDTQLIAKGLLESFDVINLLLVLEEVFSFEKSFLYKPRPFAYCCQ